MYTLLLTTAIFVACGASILTERQDIDRTSCQELGGGYGEYLQCPPGFVGVELCGSGNLKDCAVEYSHKLWCCAEVVVNDKPRKEKMCNSQSGDYGDELVCSQGMTLQGICGSGNLKDCNGASHSLTCCDDHSLVIDTNPGNCVWIFGYYGEDVACPNIMVGTGYCNGGDELDCNSGTASHGIYCCPFEMRME